MPDLAELSAGALYALVWGLIFVESGVLVAFWMPGDTVLFTAGIVAQATPGVDLWLLAAGTAVAATGGNAVGYWTGARYGRPWLEKRPPKVLKHLARAEGFYQRYGSMALVVARFIPWARTFVPVLAGVSRMRYSQFLVATVAGALVWGAGLIVLGYYAATVPQLRTAAHVVAVTAVALSVVVPVVGALRNRRAARRAGAAAPVGEVPADQDAERNVGQGGPDPETGHPAGLKGDGDAMLSRVLTAVRRGGAGGVADGARAGCRPPSRCAAASSTRCGTDLPARRPAQSPSSSTEKAHR